MADFGLSRFKSSASSLMTGHCGSSHWMAPEVVEGGSYTELADVYSFAINLWELWSRKVPYEGMQPIQIVHAVVHQQKRPPVPADCPPAVAALMRACWQQDPSTRPHFGTIIARLSAMLEAEAAEAGIQ